MRRTGAQEVRLLAERLRVLCARLEGTDLTPGPVVDRTCGDLVALALRTTAAEVATVPADLVARVRALAAAAEARLELHWSAAVAEGRAALEEFPYAAQYRTLCHAEEALVRQTLASRAPVPAAAGASGASAAVTVAPAGRVHVVVAGSGPLPLTALSWAARHDDVQVHCVDRDPAALAAGERLARSQGLGPGRIGFEHADVARAQCLAGADVVHVAALVGDGTAAKAHLLDDLASAMAPGALLAVRSVPTDGRQLLYPQVDLAALAPLGALEGTWEPDPPVINSLHVVRVA